MFSGEDDQTNGVPAQPISPDGASPVAEPAEQGVTGASPTPTGAVDPTPQPGPVPYDRFSEVNQKAKAAEARAKELEAQLLETYQQQATAPQPAQEPVFDPETAEAIRRTAGVQEVQDRMVLWELRQKYPELAGREQEFFDVYGKMRRPGMDGTMAVADAIVAQMRAKTTGDTVNTMVQQQVQREATKAEVAVPDGATPAPEKPKSWADMTEAEIIAHNEAMAAEALLRTRI